MLINFSVRNFKSINDEITLSFEAKKSEDLESYYVYTVGKYRILKLGIIYGANASGKTTILEALEFLRVLITEPFNTKTEKFNINQFAFKEKNGDEDTFFSIEYIYNEIKYLYEVNLDEECVRSERLFFFNPNRALVYERTTDKKRQLVNILFGSKISISKENKNSLRANTLWNNTVIGGYQKTNIDFSQLQDSFNWFNNILQGIITPKSDLKVFLREIIKSKEIEKESLIKILNKADFCISDIVFRDEAINVNEKMIEMLRENDFFNENEIEKIKKKGKLQIPFTFFQHTLNNNNYLLPIEQESSGTKRYYEFSGLLTYIFKNEKVIFIDELGSSLHPDLIKHFILTFLVNSKKSQLIVTTHFRELLMEKDILRNDVVWFTEKRVDGSTDLFNLSDFDSSIIRNTNSIYNTYKAGKLGAIPKLGDYFIDL